MFFFNEERFTCFANDVAGWRIGKGAGFSDMEYAMMVSIGAVDSSVPVVTVVHDCQVLDFPESLFGSHDLPVDYIVTPTRVIKCEGCLLYTSPSPRDRTRSRMPSSA